MNSLHLRTLLALGGLAAVVALPVHGQETNISSFYGSQNLQYISIRYMPWLPPLPGNAYEMAFGFNTSSKNSQHSKYWNYFYGVALVGGGFVSPQADLGRYERRDATAGYGLIRLENKVFVTTEGPVRPYFGAAAGFGTGSIWLETDADLPDPPVPALTMYVLGVEAGLHVPYHQNRAFTAAVGFQINIFQFGEETRMYYPLTITFGLSKWLGPLE